MVTYVYKSFAGTSGKRGLTLPVKRKASQSQTMASPGTTTISVPADNGDFGGSIFRVSNPPAGILVNIAPTPNASTGAVDYVAAGEVQDFGGDAGDKLAWILP